MNKLPDLITMSISKKIGFVHGTRVPVTKVTRPTVSGIGEECRAAVKAGATHLVCSSGGNAGMATAYSAKRLGVK